jgi:hypothetical protein
LRDQYGVTARAIHCVKREGREKSDVIFDPATWRLTRPDVHPAAEVGAGLGRAQGARAGAAGGGGADCGALCTAGGVAGCGANTSGAVAKPSPPPPPPPPAARPLVGIFVDDDVNEHVRSDLLVRMRATPGLQLHRVVFLQDGAM